MIKIQQVFRLEDPGRMVVIEPLRGHKIRLITDSKEPLTAMELAYIIRDVKELDQTIRLDRPRKVDCLGKSIYYEAYSLSELKKLIDIQTLNSAYEGA